MRNVLPSRQQFRNPHRIKHESLAGGRNQHHEGVLLESADDGRGNGLQRMEASCRRLPVGRWKLLWDYYQPMAMLEHHQMRAVATVRHQTGRHGHHIRGQPQVEDHHELIKYWSHCRLHGILKCLRHFTICSHLWSLFDIVNALPTSVILYHDSVQPRMTPLKCLIWPKHMPSMLVPT